MYLYATINCKRITILSEGCHGKPKKVDKKEILKLEFDKNRVFAGFSSVFGRFFCRIKKLIDVSKNDLSKVTPRQNPPPETLKEGVNRMTCNRGKKSVYRKKKENKYPRKTTRPLTSLGI